MLTWDIYNIMLRSVVHTPPALGHSVPLSVTLVDARCPALIASFSSSDSGVPPSHSADRRRHVLHVEMAPHLLARLLAEALGSPLLGTE